MNCKKSVRKQWSKDEDSSLLQLIAKYGTNGCWLDGFSTCKILLLSDFTSAKILCFRPQIAAKMVARTGKQCRERYINHLDPDIKRTPWSKQEDRILRELFPSIATKWSQYIEYLPGRSDNAIKNRYHVISRYGMKSSSRSDIVGEVLSGRKRSINDATSSESDGQEDQREIRSIVDVHQKRMKHLKSARDMLDQRIRELEESGSFLSSSSSPSDLSTTFCEETIMSELDAEFDDFDFLWSGNEAIVVQQSGSALNLGFDFDCYEVQA